MRFALPEVKLKHVNDASRETVMKYSQIPSTGHKSIPNRSFDSPYAISDAENLPLGLWRLSDPKISLASISAMFLGACVASAQGPVNWLWFIPVFLGIICLEAAKNASGDVFDYDSGADIAVTAENRSPFSGGKRVIVDGLMTREQTVTAAAVFYILGIVSGLSIVLFHEPKILLIGILGVTLAYFYNAPPLKLSYRGFGEAAVAITYGPLICCGTYIALRHELTTTIILLSIPLGILISAFLVINEFPDRKSDLGAGKMNLVVRLEEQKAGWLFAGMIIIAFFVIFLLLSTGVVQSIWPGLIGLPFGLAAIKRVTATKETAALIPAQQWTLVCFVLTAFGLGLSQLI